MHLKNSMGKFSCFFVLMRDDENCQKIPFSSYNLKTSSDSYETTVRSITPSSQLLPSSLHQRLLLQPAETPNGEARKADGEDRPIMKRVDSVSYHFLGRPKRKKSADVETEGKEKKGTYKGWNNNSQRKGKRKRKLLEIAKATEGRNNAKKSKSNMNMKGNKVLREIKENSGEDNFEFWIFQNGRWRVVSFHKISRIKTEAKKCFRFHYGSERHKRLEKASSFLQNVKNNTFLKFKNINLQNKKFQKKTNMRNMSNTFLPDTLNLFKSLENRNFYCKSKTQLRNWISNNISSNFRCKSLYSNRKILQKIFSKGQRLVDPSLIRTHFIKLSKRSLDFVGLKDLPNIFLLAVVTCRDSETSPNVIIHHPHEHVLKVIKNIYRHIPTSELDHNVRRNIPTSKMSLKPKYFNFGNHLTLVCSLKELTSGFLQTPQQPLNSYDKIPTKSTLETNPTTFDDIFIHELPPPSLNKDWPNILHRLKRENSQHFKTTWKQFQGNNDGNVASNSHLDETVGWHTYNASHFRRHDNTSKMTYPYFLNNNGKEKVELSTTKHQVTSGSTPDGAIMAGESNAPDSALFFSLSLTIFAFVGVVIFIRRCVRCPPPPAENRYPPSLDPEKPPSPIHTLYNATSDHLHIPFPSFIFKEGGSTPNLQTNSADLTSVASRECMTSPELNYYNNNTSAITPDTPRSFDISFTTGSNYFPFQFPSRYTPSSPPSMCKISGDTPYGSSSAFPSVDGQSNFIYEDDISYFGRKIDESQEFDSYSSTQLNHIHLNLVSSSTSLFQVSPRSSLAPSASRSNFSVASEVTCSAHDEDDLEGMPDTPRTGS